MGGEGERAPPELHMPISGSGKQNGGSSHSHRGHRRAQREGEVGVGVGLRGKARARRGFLEEAVRGTNLLEASREGSLGFLVQPK